MLFAGQLVLIFRFSMAADSRPQWPKVFRVDYGHEEVRVKFGKDPRQYSTTTKEFVDDGKGNVKGVNTVQVEWTQSATGAWSMKEMPGMALHGH